jgi:DNA-binding NarL/FixJ family response regulator
MKRQKRSPSGKSRYLVPSSSEELNLLVYSNNHELANALSSGLSSEAKITFCAKVDDLLALLQTRSFHALLLGSEHDSEAVQTLRSSALKYRIPLFLVTSEAAFRPAMVFAAQNGIIEPSIRAAELRQHIAECNAGHFIPPAWFTRRISEIMRLSYIGYREDFVRETHLTPLEVKVLDLLARHLENKEIAENLSLSEPLVRKMVRSVYSKLGVRRRTEAAVFWSKLLD